ncbi:MAG: ribosome small subunit-dependent GTPase A [bacterium]|nr:ribosome small subunit-dependent GTPase A [Candidatus Minthenecus merdequi]
MKGLIIRTGSVDFGIISEGTLYSGVIKGNFRIKGIKSTNPLTVGDWVDFDPTTGFITKLYDRRNYLVRRPTNLSKQLHIIGANIDQALLVITFREPETDLGFIDRFLATAEAYSIPTVLCLNKVDLLLNEDFEFVENFEYLYNSIGYRTIRLVAGDNHSDMSELAELLAGKITLISGNSGVGKSTIINRLVPEAETRIGNLSTAHHKGMHTTTFSKMYEFRNGYVIDTPGIKGFGVVDMKENEISHFFPEIFKTAEECRFSDCTHTNEPGCAVIKAVQNHQIAISRYQNYLAIRQDIGDGKYRH